MFSGFHCVVHDHLGQTSFERDEFMTKFFMQAIWMSVWPTFSSEDANWQKKKNEKKISCNFPRNAHHHHVFACIFTALHSISSFFAPVHYRRDFCILLARVQLKQQTGGNFHFSISRNKIFVLLGKFSFHLMMIWSVNKRLVSSVVLSSSLIIRCQVYEVLEANFSRWRLTKVTATSTLHHCYVLSRISISAKSFTICQFT